VRLELVCLRHSILLCNVTLFYSFSKIIEKKTKKSNIPPKEERKSIFFIGSIMSRPWIKHICSFVCQTLGFNMTLGSCSCYIELCPPPFDYSSKHMESLRCLLPRKLMLMSCCLSLIICRAVVQGKFFTKPESTPLQFCLLPSCPTILNVQSSPCSKSMKPPV
jgi:hypothetical protein